MPAQLFKSQEGRGKGTIWTIGLLILIILILLFLFILMPDLVVVVLYRIVDYVLGSLGI